MPVPTLALASALCSAASTVLISRGLVRYGPYTGTWVNLVVGSTCVWIALLFAGGLGRPTASAVAYFALAGLIGTVGGRLLRFISIETVGASISAALINLSPLVASTLAIAVLGERVTVPILVGTLVIVGGTTLLSAAGRPAPAAVGAASGARKVRGGFGAGARVPRDVVVRARAASR